MGYAPAEAHSAQHTAHDMRMLGLQMPAHTPVAERLRGLRRVKQHPGGNLALIEISRCNEATGPRSAYALPFCGRMLNMSERASTRPMVIIGGGMAGGTAAATLHEEGTADLL